MKYAINILYFLKNNNYFYFYIWFYEVFLEFLSKQIRHYYSSNLNYFVILNIFFYT